MFYIIIKITCLCLGIRIVTDEDKLFFFLRDWTLQWMPMFMWKPMIGCCACMASFWGSAVFWYYHYNSLITKTVTHELLTQWVFSCLFASFLNEFFWNLLIRIRDK